MMENRSEKGVAGFSERLNLIFDLAGAPESTRLTWGAQRWSVVPNTVRNWIRLDTPPQNYLTLDLVVSDLLSLVDGSFDKAAVIGWLFAGGKNPLEVDPVKTHGIKYEDLFSFFKREIHVRIVSCSNKKMDDPLYKAALHGAESLVQSFLVVGELVINKFIFENRLDGEPFNDARKQFLDDYRELTVLLDGLGRIDETVNRDYLYLMLANRGFSNIRGLIAVNEYFQVHEIADSLHNLGDWESTDISLSKLIEEFPTRENLELIRLFKEIPQPKL